MPEYFTYPPYTSDGDTISNPTFFGKLIKKESDDQEAIVLSGYYEYGGFEWDIVFKETDFSSSSKSLNTIKFNWLRLHAGNDARVRFTLANNRVGVNFTIFDEVTRKVVEKKYFEIEKTMILPGLQSSLE